MEFMIHWKIDWWLPIVIVLLPTLISTIKHILRNRSAPHSVVREPESTLSLTARSSTRTFGAAALDSFSSKGS